MRTRVLRLLIMLLGLASGAIPTVRAEEEVATGPAVGASPALPLPVALRPRGRSRSPVGAVEWELEWTAVHQARDGHWSSADFDLWVSGLEIDRASRLDGRGSARHDVTVTSLAVCAYLGAGWTHRGRHRYADNVARGLRWLKRQQREDGQIGPDGDLRAHAWATLALTEAYGMTGSAMWHGAAQRAQRRLLSLQREDGAWPRGDGGAEDDLLGTFLASLCLKSLDLIERDVERRGRERVFNLDPERLSLARNRFLCWLDERTDERTGIVTAVAGDAMRAEEHPLLLTAAGVLARMHLGADPRKHDVVKAAAAHLAKHPPQWNGMGPTADLAYMWFGTLALFQVGGAHWKTWNERLKTQIVDNQRRVGAVADVRGSWDPRGPWVSKLGRVGSTALSALCLEVYYRYDKVFGTNHAPVGKASVQRGTWIRSALPPHAAQFKDADGTVLPIESARVAAEVHGVRARVVLDLWVRNPDRRQREGRLKLRLPDGAAPYYLAFGESTWERAAPFDPETAASTGLAALRTRQTGTWGSVREARMAPTAAARETYERIVRQRRDPALLTWAGGGVFDLGVFPLLPGQLHRVVLGYEVDLTPVGGQAHLDLHLPDDVPDVAAVLTVRGASVRTEPEAPVVNGVRRWANPSRRDIRVLVSAPDVVVLVGPDASGREHTAAWVQPDIPIATREGVSRRAVFLLDTSSSGKGASIAVRLKLLDSILSANEDALEEFALVLFHADVDWWRDGFVRNTEANRAALREDLRLLVPIGATNLHRALTAVASVERPFDLFLLSDGAPTWGVTDPMDLVCALRPEGDDTGQPRVFAYRTGLPGESLQVLERLTAWTGGALISVFGEGDVAGAATAHRHGVWTLKGLELPGVTDLFAAGRPTAVYRGQQLRLVGRGRPDPGAELRIHLERGPHSRSLRIPLPPASSSPMAARAYGHAAVVELETVGEAGRDSALAFASHFRVVREVAALVMLESEEDYATLGLGTIDHAARVAAEPVSPVLAKADKRRRRSAGGWTPRLPGLLGDVAMGSRPGFALPPQLLEAITHVPAARRTVLGEPGEEVGTRSTSRVTGHRLEVDPKSLDALLAAVFDAWDTGRRRLAYVALCGGAARHSRSRLLQWQLARLAMDLGLDDQALVWFELALAWPGGDDLVDIVANDYARFLRHVLAGRREIALQEFAALRARSLESLRLVEEADEVVLLVASAASPDVELCILTPNGDRRYRTYDTGSDDAFYVGTSLHGLGPKMFVDPDAAPSALQIEAVPRQGLSKPTGSHVFVRVVLVRDWGRADERTVVRRLRVTLDKGPTRIAPMPP